MCGCRAISYGWGRGHIGANNAAFERCGLAQVAASRRELEAALVVALRSRRPPDLSFATLPSAPLPFSPCWRRSASRVDAALAGRTRDHVGNRA
jgi:hypothetical protein